MVVTPETQVEFAEAVRTQLNRKPDVNLGTLREYLLEKKGATEEFPFGPEVMVFKVRGKIFALVAYEEIPLRINLKCDPEHALRLRDRYAAVRPGYHMNKKHWNTVAVDGSIPDSEIRAWIDESYDLVVQGLTRADREALL